MVVCALAGQYSPPILTSPGSCSVIGLVTNALRPMSAWVLVALVSVSVGENLRVRTNFHMTKRVAAALSRPAMHCSSTEYPRNEIKAAIMHPAENDRKKNNPGAASSAAKKTMAATSQMTAVGND